MNLQDLAPETKESLHTTTVSISINNHVLRELDDTVEVIREKGRKTNRSKLIENILKETLAQLQWQ